MHFHLIIRPENSVENYAPAGVFEALIQGLEETGRVHVYSNWQSVPDLLQFTPQRDMIFFWGFDDLASHAVLHEAIQLGIPCVEINHSWFDCVRGEQFRFTLLQGQGVIPCLAPRNNGAAYLSFRLKNLLAEMDLPKVPEKTTAQVERVLIIPPAENVALFLGETYEEVLFRMKTAAQTDYPYLPEKAFKTRKKRNLATLWEDLATHQDVYVYNSGVFVEAFLVGNLVHAVSPQACPLPQWRKTFGGDRKRKRLLGFLAQQQGSLAEMATPNFVLHIIARQNAYGDVMLAE